jgi:hypothetical protein
MSSPLMNLLLVTWIRSPITTAEMWAALTSNLNALLNWKAVLLQWQVALSSVLFLAALLSVSLRSRLLFYRRSCYS